MEKFFHLKENGTTVSTEILAGLTTFFAMAYATSSRCSTKTIQDNYIWLMNRNRFIKYAFI